MSKSFLQYLIQIRESNKEEKRREQKKKHIFVILSRGMLSKSNSLAVRSPYVLSVFSECVFREKNYSTIFDREKSMELAGHSSS